MKNYFYAAVLVLFFSSCEKDEKMNVKSSVIGKWKLIELYSDPGDGSGTFHKVESNKMVEFHSDGSITSNGSLCNVSEVSDIPTSGTFTLTDSIILSPDCDHNAVFKLSNSNLIIYQPCIEGCGEKYVKE